MRGLCLLGAGVVAALAVAWTLAFVQMKPTDGESMLLKSPEGLQYFATGTKGFGHESWVANGVPLGSFAVAVPQATWTNVPLGAAGGTRIGRPANVFWPGPDSESTRTDQWGWPLRAFAARTDKPAGGGTTTTSYGIEIKKGTEVVLLPLMPLWLGLVADAVAFAGVAVVMGAGFWSVRRMVRSRRRCCLSCGYDKKDIAVCPECGAA